jgi:hypothetical protein
VRRLDAAFFFKPHHAGAGRGTRELAALKSKAATSRRTPKLSVGVSDRGHQPLGATAPERRDHHYIIDGVIWKIRNPQVRKDLFAHLARQ